LDVFLEGNPPETHQGETIKDTHVQTKEVPQIGQIISLEMKPGVNEEKEAESSEITRT
jgi:hypothetical protein